MKMAKRVMVGAAALSILACAAAQAGPTYLTQMRYVEASVDIGNGAPDMERRVSMDFGGFDRTASASMRIPAKVAGAGAGSAGASITQTSMLDADGIRATFSGNLVVGADLALRPVTSFKTVIDTTFVLDGPQRYTFDPSNGTANGFGLATLTGDAAFGGPDVDLTLAAFRGFDASGQSVSGELAGGTYRFTYTLQSSADDEAGLEFAPFTTSLLFTPLDAGGGTGGTTPAVVPLPSAALAGFGTLGALALAGAFHRRGIAPR